MKRSQSKVQNSPYPIYSLCDWMVERPLAVAIGKNCLAFFLFECVCVGCARNKIKHLEHQ